ncbi:MAG: type II toxin-antitoxin system VapC family toxin [Methylococcales bacterium]
MQLVDTSAWIETLTGSTLGKSLKKEFKSPESCLVPTLVQYELYKWLLREKTEEDAERVIAYTMMCEVVPLTSEIALRAAEISREHGLHATDAIIYATAQSANVAIVTCDAHFEGLPQVRFFRKNHE